MIIFKTKHHADVMMLDQVAHTMIRLMGHSDVVPGALTEEELEHAYQNLSAAMKTNSAQSGDSWDNDSVSVAHRGSPLLELLETAIRENEHVIWEKSLT